MFRSFKVAPSDGKIASGERVVVFNTGSGIKYLEAYEGEAIQGAAMYSPVRIC